MKERKPSRDRLRTSYDVASRAGVSQSAVSRCFSGAGSVSPQTRARIVAVANELNYRPNAFASGLVTRRSNLVAVLISNSTNLYHPEILTQLSKKLAAFGVRAVLFTFEDESELESLLEQIRCFQVDGAIVAASLTKDQIRAFNAISAALVLYNHEAKADGVTSVSCDFSIAEAILVDGLLAAGCRIFGIISGPTDNGVEAKSLHGIIERLALKGVIGVFIERGNFSYTSGRAAAVSLIEQHKVDAIISANDVMAFGAIDAARIDCKSAVQGALSVASLNAAIPSFWHSSDLTTFVQPVERMAEAAVAMIIERINNPDIGSEQRIFLGQLIEGVRASLGP
jgi:DNA-binding LacI/PurR family transcriptional regulator